MDGQERLDLVRELVVSGQATGPKDLAARLADAGCDDGPEALRRDLRALGAVRVAGPDGPVLAIPVDRPGPGVGSSGAGAGVGRGGLSAEVTSDPDWPLQVVVAAVVVAFVLIGVIAWLLGP